MKKILITISVMILGLVMMMTPNSYAVSNSENLTAATGTVTLQKLVHTNFSDPSNLPNFTFNFTKSEVTGTPVGGDVQNTAPLRHMGCQEFTQIERRSYAHG